MPDLRLRWRKQIERTVGAPITNTELIQNVWSGYGQLLRIHFDSAEQLPLVIKAVTPPDKQNHPRGWQSDFAHQRKLKSYQVEACWYESYASSACEKVAMPHARLVYRESDGWLLLLEDLEPQYPRQFPASDSRACHTVMEWLARFHALHLDASGEGLWETGCYWHLATRPDEWAAMSEGPLKNHAASIDKALLDCEETTLVHGDAKAANFCLSVDGKSVAAVDYQYVGCGCGMRDVAYFLGSCLSDHELHLHADGLLDVYFSTFESTLLPGMEVDRIRRIEKRWRELYSFAWADFQRFLFGWSPEHVKLNDYSDGQTREALNCFE